MKMTIGLGSPGMTSLHKAGVAGLYLTLRALDARGQRIEGLDWELSPTHVSLVWDDTNLRSSFQSLIDKSFRLENGFIALTGLETATPLAIDQLHHLNVALLNSFLQFGPHRPTGAKQTLNYEIDDRRYWIKDFALIKSYRHQHAAEDFVDASGRFKEMIEAAGWLYPGGGQRHVVHAATKLNEPLELALALLFAPVGVIYYTIKSRTRGRKARLAMLIPEIKNLALYANVRQAFAARGVLEMTASSPSDAALRMLVTEKANLAGIELSSVLHAGLVCRVITFGIVSWNEKQKSRTYTCSVHSNHLPGLENYRRANAIFPNHWQRVAAKVDRNGSEAEPARDFVTTFAALEFIADNIANGAAWYHDLATYLGQKEFREQLSFERKELCKMVQNASFEDESERLFIHVCHEAWRRRLGKLGKRSANESTNFSALIRKDAEKLRTSLARCKNAESLRATVVDFWSRGGSNELLRGDALRGIMAIFSEKNWKKARDLSLLALISYQPQSKEEEEALAVTHAQEGETDE